MVELVDVGVLDASSARRTRDGYLVATAKVARTGIQIYAGREIDPDNEHGLRDRATVRVYRPPDEVFSKDSLATYAHRPVTLGHPAEAVTKDNWRQHAVGHVGEDVARDGEYVRVPLVLMDGPAIGRASSDTREISMGYSVDLVFDSGTTPEGDTYEVTQRNIRINHLAMVPVARGGPSLKLDGVTMRTLMIDGIPVSLQADQDAAIIERHLSTLMDGHRALTAQIETLVADVAKLTKDLAARDSEIADLKKSKLSDADLDARVAARASLVAAAKVHKSDLVADGKSDAAIKREVVAHKRGAAFVDGKSDMYVEAAFDLLQDSVDSTSVAAAAGKGVATDAASLADAAWKQGVADLNSWRNKSAQS